MSDLAARLALLAEHAPKLRAAGVQALTIDGITLALAPPDPQQPAPEHAEAAPVSAFDDPDTYQGGKVPGFPRPADLPPR